MTLLRCHFTKLTHYPENSGKHLMLEAFTSCPRERKGRRRKTGERETEDTETKKQRRTETHKSTEKVPRRCERKKQKNAMEEN